MYLVGTASLGAGSNMEKSVLKMSKVLPVTLSFIGYSAKCHFTNAKIHSAIAVMF